MSSWPSLLRPSFTSVVRARGRGYINAVRKMRAEKDVLSAKVEGTEVYDVELSIVDRGASHAVVGVHCTCPYEDLCKHAWAVILKHSDALASLWGTPPARASALMVGNDDEDEYVYEDDDGHDDDDGVDSPERSNGRKSGAGRAQPLPDQGRVLRMGDIDIQFTEAVAALLDGRVTTASKLIMSPLGRTIQRLNPQQATNHASKEPEWKQALRRAEFYGSRRASLVRTPAPMIVDDIWYVINAERSRMHRELIITLKINPKRGKAAGPAGTDVVARAGASGDAAGMSGSDAAPSAMASEAQGTIFSSMPAWAPVSIPASMPRPGSIATAGLKRFPLRSDSIEHIQSGTDRAICALLAGAAVESDRYGSSYSSSSRGTCDWKIQPHLARTLLSLMYASGRLVWYEPRMNAEFAVKWEPDREWRLGLEVHENTRTDKASRKSTRNAVAPTTQGETEHIVSPRLERGGEAIALAKAALILPGDPGFVLYQHTLAPLVASMDDLEWCNQILSSQPPRIRRDEVGDFLRGLSAAKMPLEVEFPREWRFRTERNISPKPRLTLATSLPNMSPPPAKSLHATIDFLYDGHEVDEANSPYITTSAAGEETTLIRRDPNAESAFIARAMQLGVKADTYTRGLILHSRSLQSLVPTLTLEGWEIRGEKGLYRSPGAVSIRASSGIDWFEIQGGVSFGETSASIADILAALKRGDAFVSLGDGSLGMLPQQWLATNARWLSMGEAEGSSIRFSRAQVSIVDALLAQMPEASCDEQLAAARTRLRSFEGISPRVEPSGFHGVLRPYQREGLGWLHFLSEFGFGGCLADDMGLGKTVQILARILEQRNPGQRGLERNSLEQGGGAETPSVADSSAAAPKLNPDKALKKFESNTPITRTKIGGRGASSTASAGSDGAGGEMRTDSAVPRAPWLVVAPKSLVFNWAREAQRFTPSLKVVTHTGADRTDDAAMLAGADVVLTTYATMRLDLELLRGIHFDAVVLDEAQNIKNPTSQAAKAARLLKARRRLALTGTPVENRLDDLWSIFEFLNPGMLGSIRAFQTAMRSSPMVRSAAGGQADGATARSSGERIAAGMQHAGAKAAQPAESVDPAAALLRRALRPFMLRRTKSAVATDLPPRSEQILAVELEGKQRTMYESLRKHYQAKLLGKIDRDGIERSKIHVLEALLRLRQAACHPALIEPKHDHADSAKMNTLVEMLQELTAEGHKVLVFSQFTAVLAILRARLDSHAIRHEYLDGATSEADRAAAVDRFQTRDDARVFVISLKAGGVGLNLTAAGYVFLLDPWWNPAVEAQAIDRTHRIGQTKSVLAYRLIARGTVEERILELQSSKRELAEALVSDNQGPLASMTKEDLAWLLS
jgi:superfamily II DNA or RNA helicase